MIAHAIFFVFLGVLFLFYLYIRGWACSVREEKKIWAAAACSLSINDIESGARDARRDWQLPEPGREGLLILDHLIRRLRKESLALDPVQTSLRLSHYAAIALKDWRSGEFSRGERWLIQWRLEDDADDDGEIKQFDIYLFVYLKFKGVLHASFERLTDKIEHGRQLPL